MKITLTHPKEVRRQKKGKRLQIVYGAVAKVPFEASVKMTKQELNSPAMKKLISFSMNETFESVRERLAKYMKGFNSFSEKCYKEGIK